MDKLNYQINFIGIIAAPRKSKPLFERERKREVRMCPSAGIAHQIAIETVVLGVAELNRGTQTGEIDKLKIDLQSGRTLPFCNLHNFC